MPTIRNIKGLEILDSRGRPTIEATVRLENGITARASVPSGASTGKAEALELRDGDPSRYRGLGCRKAVANIDSEINSQLVGRSFDNQMELDAALIDLDGSTDKSRMGANAILGVSLAFAKAMAVCGNVPLYEYFSKMMGKPVTRFPEITVNLFSGGLHAGKQVPIQDVLLIPKSATSFTDSLAIVHEVYMAAVEIILSKYSARWLTADEGGLSPPVDRAEELFESAVSAIESAGFTPGKDVDLAVDVAASHFYSEKRYHIDGGSLSSSEMIKLLESWVSSYPISSIEDGLAQDDWRNWTALCERIGDRVLVLGDDLLCTNPSLIQHAIDTSACNALLLKVNQIGTLTEAMHAFNLAQSSGWHVTASVRSGETEDNWFSDLAIGWSADQTKAGSITQSERLSKYNRLLAIEDEFPLQIVHA